MWKPERSIVIAGFTLDPDEAWVQRFSQEYSRLTQDKEDLERIADWAIELYASCAENDPVELSREAFRRGVPICTPLETRC
ncbi:MULTISPECIES: hypothetical protein [unclassified Variovorax]|uniref:hypothetical protein n=1 Tax=unclassified Variovorax TaxID=663243 RepID=UPI000837D244|nr:MULTISPECIES: hypothetical protein [unclassified Variovorax]PNG56027.1 hypothetical protein CHC07_02441 [Variovorax sp. B4]PNG57451.1 hypothetical protein CHC06_02444 [Variovorax sp. B2]VTV10173.1 hypothetical protein WDL1CHR_01186 [Variovorax sp. WDL1]